MEDLMGKLQEMLSDEESMNQIKQLAEMLGGAEASDGGNENEEAPKPQESDGGSDGDFPFDIGMLFQLQGLLQSVSSEDKNSALLLALKPHLREERRGRVDKAVKLLKLFAIFTVVKESGLLKSMDLF